VVAVAAEASLALPPGTRSWPAVTVSLVLLAATGLAFLLPWNRMPGWATILVPLAYTGRGRRAARAAVGCARCPAGRGAHGLRDRIRRSQEVTARLKEQIGELMVVHDRDRLAADLQGSVVQRIFAAGLSLQSFLAMATQPELRRRVESSITDLDGAIRLLRQAIFGLENRMTTEGLQHQILRLCAEMSPVPAITFAGPVNDALAAEASERVLGLLRTTLGLLGTPAEPGRICVEAAQRFSVTVTGPGPWLETADGGESAGDVASLREQARRDSIAFEIARAADGTRLVWSVPLRSRPKVPPRSAERP
jgi:hypothetical protein